MFSLKLFALLLLLTCHGVSGFRRQSTAVRGKLTCGGVPASNVLVKLFDEDDGPDPDDLLGTGYTSEDGSFYLSGDTMELTNIDPEVRIYHSCNQHLPMRVILNWAFQGDKAFVSEKTYNKEFMLCKREWVIGIPDKYITSGNVPNKVIDLGVLNLEVELEGESRDCIH